MRRSLACLWLIGLASVAFSLTVAGPRAQTKEVTFARDIAPIVFENCVYCHRPGEVAPFSLLTYKDARPWARSIKQKVGGRQMPPWKADPHFGEFQNAKGLSDREIQTIVAWVDGGAKEGSPADMPSPPQFSEGWQIGTPDLVLTMAEPFKVARGSGRLLFGKGRQYSRSGLDQNDSCGTCIDRAEILGERVAAHLADRTHELHACRAAADAKPITHKHASDRLIRSSGGLVYS